MTVEEVGSSLRCCNEGKEVGQMSTEDRFLEEEMAAKIEEVKSGATYVVAGETEIDDEVIGAIAATAAREVEGVHDVGHTSLSRTLTETLGIDGKRARGTKVEAGKKEAIVDLEMQVVYGFSIPEIISGVRSKVGARLLELAGLVAKEVNVKVSGIHYPDKNSRRVE
jgi:uncharacterized alkaline shock family protein YloU